MTNESLGVRARYWTRWQRGRLEDRWHHSAHFDVLGHEGRTAWLCSWQRSGSTWVAEMLASSKGTRLIYEPANVPGRLFAGELSAATALPRGPGPELASIERALRGRVRGAWVDQLADGHVVQRRVVKDVRAIGLLDTVAARHPSLPIVVLVRHPLAVARSTVALGWSSEPKLSDDEQLLAEVRRWASMHARAFATPASVRALLVAYEHVVLEPTAMFGRVLSHLAGAHSTWDGLDLDEGRLAAPSATSFRRDTGAAPHEWIGTFADLSSAVVQESARIIAEEGLGALYGEAPEPLVDADGFARVLAAR